MQHLEWVLPSLLLLIAFGYKVVIDTRFGLADCIERLLEMPIEIIFLAGSFLIAFILKDAENQLFGFYALLVGILASLFVYVVSNRAKEAFLSDEYVRCGGLALASFAPAAYIFQFSVGLLLI